MDYDQLLARYEGALNAILELELQIWELCSQNARLQQALSDMNSADSGSRTSPSEKAEMASKSS